MSEIDSSNRFCVARGDDGRLRIGVLPLRPLDREAALNLAGWLVALADRRPLMPGSDFEPVLRAILEA